ncbi:MAG: reverse transcriptase family protein [Myxococcota bacterium]
MAATANAPRADWPEIVAAGGIDAWIRKRLEAEGLIEPVDTSKLSDAEKAAFKSRREEERRVRALLQKAARAAYKRAHLVHLGRGIFHHDTVDIDRFDVDDPEARRKDNALPELKSAQDLAKALGLDIPRLRWLTFHREVDRGTHYQRFTIPKRDGGKRLISAPKPDLKAAQTWIRTEITEHLPIHGCAHGFVTGRGTKTNAEAHAGGAVVIKLDLKDFYPTIGWKRVKGLFRKAGYGEQVATVLALLCTESPREEQEIRGQRYYVAVGERSLPQGAPTSPSITNAICLHLDARLVGLARSLGFRYTRYADDLTFSYVEGSRKKAREKGDKSKGPPISRLLNAVKRIVIEEGFVPHPDKTRVMRKGGRQKVTGLIVNGAKAVPLARVPRKTVRNLEAAVTNREHGKPGKGETLAELKGLAAYVYMTSPAKGRALLERIGRLEGAQP